MRAIQVKYLGPTTTKGTRWKAEAAMAGNTITVAHDYSMGADDNAKAAALALMEKVGWHVRHEIHGSGTLPNGDFVFTLRNIER